MESKTINRLVALTLALNLCAVVYVLFFHNDGTVQLPYTSTKDSTTVYLQDTANHFHNTTNIYQSTVQIVPPKAQVDTAQILQDYFTKIFAVDSLQDSLVKIKVSDTLYKNRIQYRKYKYSLIKPYQVITRVNTTQTFTNTVNGLYVGPMLDFGRNTVQGAGVKAEFVTKRFAYGIGADILKRNLQAEFLIKVK